MCTRNGKAWNANAVLGILYGGQKKYFAEPLLQELGNKYGKTSAQIALRYLVQNKIAVIPKSVHQERMKQNLAVFDFEISQEDMKKIEKLDGGKTLFGWY